MKRILGLTIIHFVFLICPAKCQGQSEIIQWDSVEDLNEKFTDGCRQTSFVLQSRNTAFVVDTLAEARKTEFNESAVNCKAGICAFDGKNQLARLKWEPVEIIASEDGSEIQGAPVDAACFRGLAAVYSPSVMIRADRVTTNQLEIRSDKAMFRNSIIGYLNPIEVSCCDDENFLTWIKPGWEKGERLEIEVDEGDGIVTLKFADSVLPVTRSLTLSIVGKYPVITERYSESTFEKIKYVFHEIINWKKTDAEIRIPISIHTYGTISRGEKFLVKQWEGTISDALDNPFDLPIAPDTRIVINGEDGKKTVRPLIIDNRGLLDLRAVAKEFSLE